MREERPDQEALQREDPPVDNIYTRTRALHAVYLDEEVVAFILLPAFNPNRLKSLIAKDRVTIIDYRVFAHDEGFHRSASRTLREVARTIPADVGAGQVYQVVVVPRGNETLRNVVRARAEAIALVSLPEEHAHHQPPPPGETTRLLFDRSRSSLTQMTPALLELFFENSTPDARIEAVKLLQDSLPTNITLSKVAEVIFTDARFTTASIAASLAEGESVEKPRINIVISLEEVESETMGSLENELNEIVSSPDDPDPRIHFSILPP